MSNPPKLCFVHVPKCGGTSIASALIRAQGWRTRFLPGQTFTLNSRASAQAAQWLGCDVLTYRWHVLTYHLQRDVARLLYGHFPCPPETIDRFGDNTAFVTILRNPVDRWISQYLYDRYKSGDYHRITLSAADYLQTEEGRLNGQIYHSYFASRLAGARSVQPIHTLEKFAVVALLEDLQTLTAPYRQKFGRDLSIARERASPAPVLVRRELEDPTLRREIARICAPDIEIYEAARQRLVARRDV